MNKYLLNEILCGDNKLIIPDLQRDYCWAEHHLVEPFISGLMDQYLNPSSREKKLNMGLLYWYKGLPDYYWQLCDGQQRITTLFLCLGILNRKCEGNPFSDLLISPFELNDDDKEPRLQYAIRESSLYFLSDLVCRFFLDKSVTSAGDIPSQPWFFNDYLISHNDMPSFAADSSSAEVLFSVYVCISYPNYTNSGKPPQA